ncbi:hypothetical protein [Exiguobacterium sp. NG55]|uniref:hypothetical protein n=1 Tax=Exiguobacterium sp. NG55 TaxID=375477 RepID=UPI0004DF0807|nr:hypothetical protein [Exiguobacterium sp. NG55]
MNLRKPIAINKKYKPVLIFKDGVELKECVSIQEAATFLKGHTFCRAMPYRHIMNGIIFDETWIHKGSTYRFTTDPEVKKQKLDAMRDQHRDRF